MTFRAWPKSQLVGAFVVALLSAGRAQAQVGTGGTGLTTGAGGSGGATFTSDDIFVGVQAVPGVNLVPADAIRFFNQARCNCSTPVTIFVALQQSGFAKRSTITTTTGNLSIVLGPACGSVLGQITGQVSNCVVLGNQNVLTFLNKGSFSITTDARQLSTYLALTTFADAGAGSGSDACTSTIGQFPQTINAVFDFNGDSIVDLNVTDSLTIDLTPPPAPTGVTIQGGDEALVMNWTAIDTSLIPDLLGYQILCSRADQYQVFKESGADGGANGPFNSGFLTCPQTRNGTGVEGLDPTFVCSPLLSAEATSYRVKILQNDITYAAAVVAVDKSGNASAPIVGYGAPIKTLSFYDVYRNENPQDPGGASGGFCALVAARPRLSSTLGVLLAFGLGTIGLVVVRRRRGRR